MDEKKYAVKKADSKALYEEVRSLWCEVFGDEPSYVDGFYKIFGDRIDAYVITDDDGKAASALTLYPCGTYGGRSVYVSYAICTREDLRRHGLGAALTAYARDVVLSSGGISIVSPAAAELEAFYEALGYEPHFMASEMASMSPAFDDDEYEDFDDYDIDFGKEESGESFRPAADVQRIDAAIYNRYREAFLSGRPHIELSDAMLRLIDSESEGLYSINRGDAICAISETGPFKTVLSEFILNPVLQELSLGIDTEITAMLADRFGSAEVYYRTPGYGRCQSMAAGITEGAESEEPPYFGFPID